MEGKPMLALASYADYEDADSERVDAMKAVIAANGGTVAGEAGGEDAGEYRIAFRCSTPGEFSRIEALGADEGWEVARR